MQMDKKLGSTFKVNHLPLRKVFTVRNASSESDAIHKAWTYARKSFQTSDGYDAFAAHCHVAEV